MNPIRIRCEAHKLPSKELLNAHLDLGDYIVLEFEKSNLKQASLESIISDLSKEFPNCSVFYSGGFENLQKITIHPVTPTEKIQLYKTEITKSAESYINRCISLEQQRLQGTLPSEWDTSEHGEHCCYTNLKTGEVVEAPTYGIEEQEPKNIDPYFFSLYIKSVDGFPETSNLLTDDFHDAARILEVLFDKYE